MYIFLLLVIPILWPIAAKFIWSRDICWMETAISMAISIVITISVYEISSYAALRDTEILNGEIVSKSKDRVGCRHSYSCNCRTTGGKNPTTTCDTCYEHSYDIDWNIHANVGDVTIGNVDRQGLVTPPRWESAAKGDAFAAEHSYTNYIKAAPDSLFNRLSAEKYLSKVQDYPVAVYDYYKANRFISQVSVPDAQKWNAGISDMLRQLGPLKQVDLVIYVTMESDPLFADAVAAKWLGGKKNQVIVIVGAKNYPSIEWVRVVAWAQHDIFRVALRDLLLEHKVMQVDQTLSDIREVTLKHYARKSFKDFAYLENEFTPPDWAMWLALVVSILSTAGLTVYFKRN